MPRKIGFLLENNSKLNLKLTIKNIFLIILGPGLGYKETFRVKNNIF